MKYVRHRNHLSRHTPLNLSLTTAFCFFPRLSPLPFLPFTIRLRTFKKSENARQSKTCPVHRFPIPPRRLFLPAEKLCLVFVLVFLVFGIRILCLGRHSPRGVSKEAWYGEVGSDRQKRRYNEGEHLLLAVAFTHERYCSWEAGTMLMAVAFAFVLLST